MKLKKIGLILMAACALTICPLVTAHAERYTINYSDPKIQSGLNNLQSIEGNITTFIQNVPEQHTTVTPGPNTGSYFGDTHWNMAFIAVYGDGTSTAYELTHQGSDKLVCHNINKNGISNVYYIPVDNSLSNNSLNNACLTAVSDFANHVTEKQNNSIYNDSNVNNLFIKKGTTNIVEPAFFVRWSNDFYDENSPSAYTSRDRYGTAAAPYDIPVFTNTTQDQINGPLWSSAGTPETNYYNMDNLVTKDTLTKFLGYDYTALVNVNPTLFARTAAWQKWTSSNFTVKTDIKDNKPKPDSSTPFAFSINEVQITICNKALLFHKPPTITETITPKHVTTKVEGGKANINVSISGPAKGAPLDMYSDFEWSNGQPVRPKNVDYYYSSIKSKLEVKDVRDRLVKSTDIQSSNSNTISYQLNDIEFNKDAIGYAKSKTYYTYKENMDWVSDVEAIYRWVSRHHDDGGYWVFDHWEPHYSHLDIQYPNSGDSLPILSSTSNNITLIGSNGVSYTIDELNDIVKKYEAMNSVSSTDKTTTTTTVDITAFKNQLAQLTQLQKNIGSGNSNIYLPNYGEASIDGQNYLTYEKKFFVQGLTQNTNGNNPTEATTSKAKNESDVGRDIVSDTGQ